MDLRCVYSTMVRNSGQLPHCVLSRQYLSIAHHMALDDTSGYVDELRFQCGYQIGSHCWQPRQNGSDPRALKTARTNPYRMKNLRCDRLIRSNGQTIAPMTMNNVVATKRSRQNVSTNVGSWNRVVRYPIKIAVVDHIAVAPRAVM